MTRPAIAALAAIAFVTPAHAYIGPGAGLGAVGAAIALSSALILLIVGFAWYPVKRLLRGRKTATPKNETDQG